MATALPRIDVPLTLEEVARQTGGTLRGDPSLRLVGLGTDTRALHPGALFVALRGERFDAHDHLDAAMRSGAAALLVRAGAAVPEGAPCVFVPDTLAALGRIAREHALSVRRAAKAARPAGIPVVAISGAVGKTTTKELTAAALAAATKGRCHATVGNLNNLVGAPFTLLGLSTDDTAMVVECGSNGHGEIARIGEMTRPDVSMCMNADAAHTEGLGSIDAVADEEGSIFAFASRAVVANADEPRSRARTDRAPAGCARWLFGVAAESHVRLVSRTLLDDCRARLRFAVSPELCPDVGEIEVESPLLGAAVACNIAAALCATAATGVDAEGLRAAAKAIESVKAVPGRLVLRELPSGTRVIDDTYNASPRAVRAALEAASEIAEVHGSRLVVALGDMLELGSLSEEEHLLAVDRVCDAGATVLVAVGAEMTLAASHAQLRGLDVHLAMNSIQGAEKLCAAVKPRDVVLVKGSRGMRMERCVEALAEVTR
ncbi:MAG: UDP-N-acetylmuramoyl-tripeptide--D-alanyl-D-alanine ligase [Polyangiales bacterium]